MSGLSEESLGRLRTETRDLLQRQLSTQSELDAKAADSVKFNTLVFGILVSALSLTSHELPLDGGLNPWIGAALVLGLILLGLSIIIGVIAYRATRLGAGLQAEGIREALDEGATDDAVLRGMVQTYTDLIETNRDRIDRTAHRVNLSMYLLIGGLVSLGAGMLALIYLAI